MRKHRTNQHEWGVVMHHPLTGTEVSYCPLCKQYQGYGPDWKGIDLRTYGKYIPKALAMEIIEDGQQYPGEFYLPEEYRKEFHAQDKHSG